MTAREAVLTGVRAYYRQLLLAAVTAVAALVSLGLHGTIDLIDGPLYDLALAAAAHFRQPPAASDKVAVIALDRRSLASPELKATPRVLLGPQWAKLVDALAAAKAQAVGFDVIFTFNANGLLPNYDKPFIDMLVRNRHLLVLGRSLETPIANPFYFALGANGDPNSMGYVEVTADADGVIRRPRATLALDGGTAAPTLIASLLRRAGHASVPPDVLLAPSAPLETLPTYALIDVLRCADKAPDRLAQAFSGRIVLIGTTLPEEDRKSAPDRYMPRPRQLVERDIVPTEGCQLTPLGASAPDAATIPGVFVHAAAIQAMLGDDVANEAPSIARLTLVGAWAFLGGGIGLALSPWLAVAALLLVAFISFAGEAALLGGGLWLPVALPVAAAAIAMVTAYLSRFLVEERQRRRIQHAFGHYLAPAVVEQLLTGSDELRLGGTTQEVSIMFADLSGFTALSGEVGPEQLMDMTNQYLQIIAEAVDASGGYVDKFIGDAVMAIWGAPAKDADHAAHAAGAALHAADRIAARRASDRAQGRRGFSVKIGINSGPATVGNVGAPKRYNYTAVGETVNIASRLESVPGDYGCRVVLGPRAAALAGGAFLLNELDWIKVKGKREPLAVFELVCDMAKAGAVERAYVSAYATALAAYRRRDFVAAQALWQATAHPSAMGSPQSGLPSEPTPPSVMAARAIEMEHEPPPADWDGVWVKTSK